MIYINGRRASKRDILTLLADLKTGRAKVTSDKRTKKGARSIKTV
jgi:hypothetical protein